MTMRRLARVASLLLLLAAIAEARRNGQLAAARGVQVRHGEEEVVVLVVVVPAGGLPGGPWWSLVVVPGGLPDTHPCSLDPCSANATCVATGEGQVDGEGRGYLCMCPSGYVGERCHLRKGPCLTNGSGEWVVDVW
ncbi:hypothetical protein CRUP_006164 [Coryphaenoides rupestris]|nr:hypothetical protein CRUP_006164 [Coryphaenoides rupestris]